MKAVIYNGPDVNLGHHGVVTNGKILHLSPAEYADIQGDSRFVDADSAAAEKATKEALANLEADKKAQAEKDQAAREAFDKKQREETGGEPAVTKAPKAPKAPKA